RHHHHPLPHSCPTRRSSDLSPLRYGHRNGVDERATPKRAPRMNSIASASIVSQVLGLLVPVGSTRCRAYTSGLSTSWSSRGLTGSSPWEISSWGELRT